MLDKRVVSGADDPEPDLGRGPDHRRFTQQEAQDLSLTLQSGALPASLTYLEERTVGPSLGADSIRAGVMASIGGLVLVVLFMLVYYKLTGSTRSSRFVVNLIILLGLMAYFGATMTLPGIAGFILTIGMGVDSNVLIFERIKEELALGRTRTRRRQRRLRPGVVDDRRHPRVVAHRGAAAAAVRHRADPRLCHDADHRAAVERVHRRVRVAHDVRAGAVAPPAGRRR